MMDSKTLGNEPAYPTDSEHQSGPSTYHFTGLTKREAFAMAVVGSVLAEAESYTQAAEFAFELADAMLTESAKDQP